MKKPSRESIDRMAHNSGYSDYPYSRDVNEGRKGSAQGIYGRNETGLKTNDAHITEWGDPGYSQEQYHNGSMNYLSEKDHISSADVKKVRRTTIPEDMR